MGCIYVPRASGAAHEQGSTFLLSFNVSAPGLVPDLLTHADRSFLLSQLALLRSWVSQEYRSRAIGDQPGAGECPLWIF